MIALFLMFTALAVKLKWTNEKGDVDVNNRYFDKVASNYNDDLDSVNQQYLKARVFQKIGVLSNKYPKNAEIIINKVDFGVWKLVIIASAILKS